MGRGNRWEDSDVRRELLQLQQEMDRLARRRPQRAMPRSARVFPSIIISTADDRLLVRAEVPGMNLADFDINVSGDTLTIQGTRFTGEALEGGWYHRRERESGGFSRAVRLPAAVDGHRAEADYQAGVLIVSLPLKEAAKPRTIPVTVVKG